MYVQGQWNAICDICGGKFKSGQMRQTWDGLMVCEKDFDPKQPQEDITSRPDDQNVPWIRNND